MARQGSKLIERSEGYNPDDYEWLGTMVKVPARLRYEVVQQLAEGESLSEWIVEAMRLKAEGHNLSAEYRESREVLAERERRVAGEVETLREEHRAELAEERRQAFKEQRDNVKHLKTLGHQRDALEAWVRGRGEEESYALFRDGFYAAAGYSAEPPRRESAGQQAARIWKQMQNEDGDEYPGAHGDLMRKGEVEDTLIAECEQ